MIKNIMKVNGKMMKNMDMVYIIPPFMTTENIAKANGKGTK
jgi:hypothetical protein